ncbi:MAG: hypothetical protein BWY09_03175 [Candidatus Hydrogenedentes bacterium ADurb.Bin179]|nr:MAG: hypothetical protein BWY09_03175 [Candidatus Hydrogenedentes bacterium ADurb.Bin179]
MGLAYRDGADGRDFVSAHVHPAACRQGPWHAEHIIAACDGGIARLTHRRTDLRHIDKAQKAYIRNVSKQGIHVQIANAEITALYVTVGDNGAVHSTHRTFMAYSAGIIVPDNAGVDERIGIPSINTGAVQPVVNRITDIGGVRVIFR